MEMKQLLKIKKGSADLLLEWIKKYAPDEEYADLLDDVENNTRKNLKIR
ncbi:MAG: hypothetical protein ACE5KE_07940 [Methanosarcinales archaeon]